MPHDTPALLKKLAAVEQDMNAVLVDRRSAIRLLLVGLVSRKSVMLFGPRGTGKTTLVDELTKRIDGVRFFGTSLHPFKEPWELFGGLDFDAMIDGVDGQRVQRYKLARAAHAHINFLDETSRGSDAMLESLFDAVEKRRIENDGSYHALPAWFWVGAANAPFDPDRLGPLRDRFPLAMYLDYIADDKIAMLSDRYLLGFNEPAATLTVADVEGLQALWRTVTVPLTIRRQAETAVQQCRHKGVDVSDRRLLAAYDALRGEALCNGRTVVTVADLPVLNSVLWDAADQRADVAAVIAEMNDVMRSVLDLASECARIVDATNARFAPTIEGATLARKRLRGLKGEIDALLPHVAAAKQHGAEIVQRRVAEQDAELTALIKRLALEEE